MDVASDQRRTRSGDEGPYAVAVFARLFAWLRRHPRLVDLLWALPVVGASGATAAVYIDGVPPHHRTHWYLYAAIVVGMCAPLVWRRGRPRAVFAIVAVVAFGQWLAHIGLGPVDIAVLVAMYTVAATCVLRWAVAAGLVAEFGAVLEVQQLPGPVPADGRWTELIPFTVLIWAVWLSGLYLSTRRKYLHSLEERAERLERERDAQAQVAAAAERARIAREMHDVIAHSVSVMVVQADGAAYMVDLDPERARRAMQTIGEIGRQALAEMRRMLGVLREEGGGGSYAPQPGVEQLTELVAQIRSAGLPVDLTIEGVPAELPAALQLAIYRIVQEALTNTRKHGGPLATAQVRLRYGDTAVEIRIRDDGRGAEAVTDGRGHGLVGMTERAALYGGSVRSGPRPEGGYEVLARLPVPDRRTAGTHVA